MMAGEDDATAPDLLDEPLHPLERLGSCFDASPHWLSGAPDMDESLQISCAATRCGEATPSIRARNGVRIGSGRDGQRVPAAAGEAGRGRHDLARRALLYGDPGRARRRR